MDSEKLRVLGCPRCGLGIKTTLLQFTIGDDDLGVFPGFTCDNGHRYFDVDAAKDIRSMLKVRG